MTGMYRSMSNAFGAGPWAMERSAFEALAAMVHARDDARGDAGRMREFEAMEKVHAARQQAAAMAGGGAVAVIPIYGPISQRESWYCGTSTESVKRQLRAALADPNIKAIVFDVDSPGGTVSGVDELAAEIFAARSKKPTAAVSNCLNASAAYYLSSQAAELWVMPSSLTGSIGVYSMHEDDSALLEKIGIKLTLIAAGKFKVEGNSFEPLTAEAEAAMQEMVTGFYEDFLAAVARGRGVKAEAVQSGFGEGRVVRARQAVKLGLADKVGTLDGLLAKFGVSRSAQTASLSTNAEAPSAAAEGDSAAEGSEAQAAPAAKAAETVACECPCKACVDGDCDGCTTDPCDYEGCTGHGDDDGDEDDPDAKAAAVALEREQAAARLAL